MSKTTFIVNLQNKSVEPTSEDYTYKITNIEIDSEEGSVFSEDSDSLIITINAPFKEFKSLSIEGINLELKKDEDYTVKEGSTVITFTENGLKKLKTLESKDYKFIFTFVNDKKEEIKVTKTLTFKTLSEEVVANVPDTGLFNRSDALTTGVSVFGFAFLAFSLIYLLFRKLNKKAKKNENSITSDKINYKKKSSLALKSFIFVSFLATLGFLTGVIIDSSQAKIGKTTLPVSAPATLTLDANILGSDDIASKKIDLKVSDVPSSGFSLYLKSSDTKLINKDNKEVVINSITTPGSLKDNTFGYALENPEGKEDKVTWYPLTTDETGSLLLSTETKDLTTASIYFGIRSKSLKPGEYTLDLEFFALSN